MSKNLRLQVILSAVDKITQPLKNAQQANKKLAETLRQSREQLKQLNRASQTVNGFKSLSEKSKQLSDALAQASLKAKMMGLELLSLESPTKKQTAALEKQWATVNKLDSSYQKNSGQMAKMRAELYRMGISAQNNQQATAYIRQETDRYTASLKKQEQQLARIAAQDKRLTAAKTRYHNSINRRNTLAGQGVGLIASGGGVLMGVKPTLNEAAIYEKELAAFRALGVGEAVLTDAQKFATGMHIIGNSATENLKVLKEAHAVLRHYDEAKMVAPTLLKLQYATKFMSSHGINHEAAQALRDQSPSVLKIAELRNEINTPERFDRSVDLTAQAMAASGGMVLPDDYMAMLKTGGTPAKQLSNEAFYFGFSHIIQQLGGDRTGTSLNSAYQNLVKGSTTQGVMENLMSLGLLKKGSVKYGKTGHVTKMLNDALVNVELYKADPFRYLMEEMVPRIRKKYPKASESQMATHIAQLFSSRTAADVFVTMYLERSNIEKQIKAGREAYNLDQLITEGKKTAQGQQIEFEARKADLYREIGNKLLPIYIKGLEMVNSQLTKMTAFFKAHPAMTTFFGIAIGGFAALVTVGGALTLTMAAMIGPLAAVRLGLTLLSAASLTNPIVLGITAIAVAALLIYRYWDKLVPFFKNLWATIAQYFTEGYERLKTGIKQFGSELIDNLKNGIMEKWESLKTFFAEIKTIIDLAPDWLLSHENKALRAKRSLMVLNGLKSAGMFDSGGRIPRGYFGIAGEHGPEIISGPADVISRRQTSSLFESIYASPSTPQYINIAIHASPHQSPQDIAREVAYQLGRHQRQQQTQQRSRYIDNEDF
ncbi:phage tail tape measure protein [Arsenophonus nasoniae]|uniref:Phage tail tape measure protein n=1 Tax=Arsenophonus nasoniae TaxID=638 RepID=A0AA95GAE1_9GAMM|nr:hypothetical protein [Arsenophonus nasoniae]WGL95301.1 hypothetical protein QE207_16890 [Arsenophonus nasoniae]